MATSTVLTCQYCRRPATQNIVWLKCDGAPMRMAHCGCDFKAVLRRNWPGADPREVFDYLIEPLPSPAANAEGEHYECQ